MPKKRIFNLVGIACLTGLLCYVAASWKKPIVDEPTPECYLPVERLLAQHQPDSAYRLLDRLEPNLYEVPEERRYHAYILWIQAIDEADESLIPCETLLAEALAFHQQDDYLRGKILYYQARLLDEKRYIDSAIEYYLRALQILKNYPGETNRLFVAYQRTGYYYTLITEPDKAKKAFLNANRLAWTATQHVHALKRLGDLYRHLGQKDSALLCLEKGIHYAMETKDTSQIALMQNMYLFTRHRFHELEHDTLSNPYTYAMFYPNDGDSYYYENRGVIFHYERQQYDSAYHYLSLALQHAGENTEARLSAYKRLALTLKMMGRYEESIHYLELRNDLCDQNEFRIHPKSNINRMTEKIIADTTAYKARLLHQKRLNQLFFCAALLILILISLYQWRLYRKQRLMLQQKTSIATLQYEQLALQNQIDEQKNTIVLLNHVHHKDLERINQNEASLLQFEQQFEQLTLNLFKQTKIYQTISTIQTYNQKNPKNPKVLTEAQQTTLANTLQELFDEPIRKLKQNHPQLTNSDILFHYLEEMHYDTKTIAACFGKIEANSIHQRRYRIKERLKEKDPTNFTP